MVLKIIDELIKISEKILNNHKKKILINSDENTFSSIKDLSENEILWIIDKLTSKLSLATSFSEAEKIMKTIIQYGGILYQEQVKLILEKSLENGEPYNQVLDASYAAEFLKQLLKSTYEKKFDFDMWVDFYNKLTDKRKERFTDIRRSLKQKGIEGLINPGDEIDPEDLPF